MNSKNLTKINYFVSTFISNYIILNIIIIVLFIESIIVILRGFNKGIFKKEVLTNKSNLGFDLIIK